MGKNKYQKGRDFLEKLKSENTVHPTDVFVKELKKEIGFDERTIKSYIKMFLEYQMISEEGQNVRIN